MPNTDQQTSTLAMGRNVEVVAEIGSNWQDFDEIFNLIVDASNCGCDYAKLQLYDTDTIKKPWESNYNWLKEKEIPRAWVERFVSKCEVERIKPMFSVFSEDRLSWIAPFMESIDTIKIAARSSGDTTIPIISGKRYLVTVNDWATLRPEYRENSPNVWRMHTQSRRSIIDNGLDYEDFPLHYRPHPNGIYDGYSDHGVGLNAIQIAVSNGARIIEKHFTGDPNGPGWDQPGSATPWEMEELVNHIRKITRNY